MRKMTMADGICCEVIYCGASDGILRIRLPDNSMTLPEAATVFGRKDATRIMTHDWDGNDRQVFRGFTDLRQIGNLDGYIEIILQEGDTHAV